jgi:hypothetical protein
MKLNIDVPHNPLLGNEQLNRPSFSSQLKLGPISELVITLRIWFVPVDRKTAGRRFPDNSSHLHDLGLWDDTDPYEFEDWKSAACALANEKWNDQLWLWTPDDYDGLNWPIFDSKARTNVKCSLAVVEADSPREAHAQVRVVKLADPGDCLTFTSRMTLWDNLDVRPANVQPPQGPAAGFERFAVPHEVGHLLGLHHAGEVEKVGTCSLANHAKWRVTDIYGLNRDAPPWVAENIMGAGTTVHDINARPWARRMVEHTEGKTKLDDWAPYAVPIPASRPLK